MQSHLPVLSLLEMFNSWQDGYRRKLAESCFLSKSKTLTPAIGMPVWNGLMKNEAKDVPLCWIPGRSAKFDVCMTI